MLNVRKEYFATILIHNSHEMSIGIRSKKVSITQAENKFRFRNDNLKRIPEKTRQYNDHDLKTALWQSSEFCNLKV